VLELARRFFKPLRIVLWVGVIAAGVYLMVRFDLASLPKGSCSPLLAISPGDRMWIDRKPREPMIGDMVLFEDPGSDRYLLGRIVEAPDALTPQARGMIDAGALWIEGDNSGCAVRDSRLLGPIKPDKLAGRVIMTL